jgi:threonine/homoserine/homoserine lactone efflux protein
MATALMIAMLSATWYVGIALVFTAWPIQGAYRRLRRPIDAACGAVLVLLGLRLGFARQG